MESPVQKLLGCLLGVAPVLELLLADHQQIEIAVVGSFAARLRAEDNDALRARRLDQQAGQALKGFVVHRHRCESYGTAHYQCAINGDAGPRLEEGPSCGSLWS